MQCPACKAEIKEATHLPIMNELRQLHALKAQVEKMALEVSEVQGLPNAERLTTRGDIYYGKKLELAMLSCTFFECNDCKKPYFGGTADCMQQLSAEENIDKESLRCKECQVKAYGGGYGHCPKHGSEHMLWKCNYCCSVAKYHCHGNTYYCERCHSRYPGRVITYDCFGVNCPLGVPHPRAGPNVKESTYPLGCALCEKSKVNEVVIVTREMKQKNKEEMKKRAEEEKRLKEEEERRRVEQIRR